MSLKPDAAVESPRAKRQPLSHVPDQKVPFHLSIQSDVCNKEKEQAANQEYEDRHFQYMTFCSTKLKP